MPAQKLNASNKRRITKDWARLFPEFSARGTMRLFRRCGPVLVGICLNRKSSGEDYYPITHLSNLLTDESASWLLLNRNLRSKRNGATDGVEVSLHEEQYEEAAQRLEQQFPGDLRGPLSLADVFSLYQDWFDSPESGPGGYKPGLFEDIVLLTAWFGEVERALSMTKDFEAKMRTWPEDIMDDRGGLNAWLDNLRKRASAPRELVATVERRILKNRLTKIPSTDLLPSPLPEVTPLSNPKHDPMLEFREKFLGKKPASLWVDLTQSTQPASAILTPVLDRFAENLHHFAHSASKRLLALIENRVSTEMQSAIWAPLLARFVENLHPFTTSASKRLLQLKERDFSIELSPKQIQVLGTQVPSNDGLEKFRLIKERIDSLEGFAGCSMSWANINADTQRNTGKDRMILHRWVMIKQHPDDLVEELESSSKPKLNKKEEIVLAVWTFLDALESSGLAGYLANPSGDSAPLVHQFFRASACLELAEHFSALLSLFGPSYPGAPNTRDAQIDQKMEGLLEEREASIAQLLEASDIEHQLQAYLNDPFVSSAEGTRSDVGFEGYPSLLLSDAEEVPEKVLRETTHQWAASFPKLQVAGPGRLLRICGPIVQGIYLDPVHPDQGYRPRTFLHPCLGRASQAPSASGDTMGLKPGFIPARGSFQQSSASLIASIESFKAGLRFDLDKPLGLQELLRCYQEHLEGLGSWVYPEVVSEMLLLMAWAGQEAQAKSQWQRFSSAMGKGEYPLLSRSMHRPNWQAQLLQDLENPAQLRERQTKRLAAMRLSRFEDQGLESN